MTSHKEPARQTDPATPGLQFQRHSRHGDFEPGMIGAGQRAGQLIGHRIHGARGADAIGQVAKAACILRREQRSRAGNRQNRTHEATTKCS
ncbi:hypothetical protein PSC71_14070 [Devosia sp. J2-20]|uniref:hypothetical protein n=1 Tax=Devosia sp. J2-20 TaxID=3026161 RepID=UPI00249CD3BA|nr:hypothetical protein [Devosia sp. J2-20]WDR01143.1 hypothetical protein PSC71_14070 [Devosia sp. J2-20]